MTPLSPSGPPPPPVTKQAAILDALPAHLALLDGRGVIQAVNESWRRFAAANALLEPAACVGQNYLEICGRATGASAPEARTAAEGIRRVLQGETMEFVLDYPCHSPTEERWFRLLVTPLPQTAGGGAVVMHVNITERKRLEQSARESELHLRSILDSAMDAIVTIDHQGRILEFNPAAEQLFGWTRTAALGQELAELIIPPRLRDRHRQGLTRCLQGGRDANLGRRMELPALRADGTELTVELTVTRPGGVVPPRFTGFLRDITERKRAEAALAAAEAKFRDLVERSLVGIYIIQDDRFVYVNPVMTDIFDFTEEELTARPVFDFIVEADRPLARENIRRRLTVEITDIRYQLRMIRRDGQVIQTEVHGGLSEYNGRPAILGTLQDITERLRAEAALRASEANMAAAQRIAHFGSWELDLSNPNGVDANPLRWSDEMFRIAGFEPGAVPVTNELFFRLAHPDDHAAIREAVAAALQGGGQYSLVHRLVRPDGAVRIVHEAAQVFRDEAGRPLKMVGTTHDITEQRLLAEALELERTRLVAAQRVAKVGSWETDAATLDVFWSAETHRIFETDPAAFRPTHEAFLARIHPEDRARVGAAFKASLTHQSPCAIEHRILLPDGRVKFIEEHWQSFHDATGQAVRAVGTCQDITERKQAEAEARRTSELLRAVAEGTSDAVFVKDRAGRYLLFNEAAGRFVGRRVEDVLGQDDTALFDPESARIIAQSDHRVMADNAVQTVEEELTAAGATRTYLATKAPYHDSQGNVIGVIGIARDITERKRHERRLAMFSRLGQQLNTAVSARAAAQVIMAAADELFGWDACVLNAYSPEEDRIKAVLTMDTLDGRKVECPPAYDDVPPMPLTRRVLTHGKLLLLRSDPLLPEPGVLMFGDSRRPSASLMFVPLRHGERHIGLLSIQSYRPQAYTPEDLEVLQSLADHCAGALNRLHNEAKLHEQATLLDHASEAIIVKDMAHRIIYWNRGAERIYGWTAEEALGRNAIELLYRDAVRHSEAIALLMEQGKWQGEMTKRTKADRDITVEVRWSLVRDAQGRPRSILAINNDITEKKKLEAHFLRAQRMEGIGTLAGGIAHDLNNVLAPILMSVQVLKLKLADPDDQDLLDTLESSSRRGADLVKQVLGFARGVEGQRIVINPVHLMRELMQILRDTFPKNINVKFTPPRSLWTVNGDPTQLHQVLLNLCVNARDAMPDGGSLTVSMENLVIDETYAGMNQDAQPGPFVMIKVADTGGGIPPDIREKIFEPFFTTKEIGKGTGLGLSTVIAIVKSHGGFINLYSEVGKGTKFKVYLPANTTAAAADQVAIEQTGLPRGQGELILVVDDEEAIRKIAQRTLERFGYRVLLAAQGAEAVALYAQHQHEIAAVLTDMAMPIMDGPALILALRSMKPGVKIIASSGLMANGALAVAVDAGVAHFVPKPYTAEALLKTLHEVLHGVAKPPPTGP